MYAVCKYTPVELLYGFGVDVDYLDGLASDFDRADSVAHVNLCGFGKSVIQEAMAGHADELVLVNCCDTMRRSYEVIADQGVCGFVHLMDLPRTCGPCQVDALAHELECLRDRYAEASGRTFDLARCQAAFAPAAPPKTGPYLGLYGVRCGRELTRAITAAFDVPVRDLTCTGLRAVVLDDEARTTTDEQAFFRAYARALLAQTPCRRMADDAGRRALFEDPNLRGIIYHTMKFCDFYEPEYAAIRARASVPVLKIESDFTKQSAEQLTTRIEAFAETVAAALRRERKLAGGAGMGAGAGTGTDDEVCARSADTGAVDAAGTHAAEDVRAAGSLAHGAEAAAGSVAGRAARRPATAGRTVPDGFVAGIDSGSTSTDVVILDTAGNRAASAIVPTGGGAQKSAEACLAVALDEAGIDRAQVGRIVATGYGRAYLDGSSGSVTEITCHAKGAHALYPAVRTIIDIGGQDNKVIRVNADGGVESFVMNDKCAAGTGRFLEMMARALQISLDDLSTRGLKWNEDITISAMCSVFAESEVVSLVAQNKDVADIVHGLDKSVASKVLSLVKRVGGEPAYMMTGGVAQNEGVVRAIEQAVGADVYVSDQAQLAGALGAALFALEQLE
jgi:predicted CoA-substrate-specific enzyme activase